MRLDFYSHKNCINHQSSWVKCDFFFLHIRSFRQKKMNPNYLANHWHGFYHCITLLWNRACLCHSLFHNEWIAIMYLKIHSSLAFQTEWLIDIPVLNATGVKLELAIVSQQALLHQVEVDWLVVNDNRAHAALICQCWIPTTLIG